MLTNRIKSRFLSSVLLASVLGVAGVATAVEVGEKAPDFTLPSTTGKDISLSERSEEQRLNSSHIQKSRMPSSA